MIPAPTRSSWPTVLSFYACVLLLGVLVGSFVAKASIFEDDLDLYMAMGAALVAFAGLAILLEWRLGVFLLGAALPFEGLLAPGVLASGTKVLALVTFSSLGLRLLLDRRLYAKSWQLLQQPLMLTLLALLCWSTASILWATNQDAALVKASTFVGCFGLALTIGLLKVKELILLWAIVASSMLLSIPLGYALSEPESAAASGRFTSGGQDPNDYAGLLVIVFFVAYYMLGRRFSVAKYLLALPTIFGVLATESRTALLALLSTPLLVLWMPGAARRSMKAILITYGLLALVFAGTIYAVPALGQDILERYATLSQYQNEDTWAGRLELWNAAIRMLLSDPLRLLLGVGVGNFPDAAATYSSLAAFMNSQREGAAVAHNIFLSVASELGLVGLALFSSVLLLAFRQAWALAGRGSAVGMGLLFGLTTYTVMGLTLSWEAEKIGYFLLGSILALYSPGTMRNTIQKPDGQA